jgi:hypothetical protein
MITTGLAHGVHTMVLMRFVLVELTAGLLCGSFLLLSPSPIQAEWYAAVQLGVNFADPIRNVRGTGTLAALAAPNFNLKTSPSFGGKLGVFPNHGIFGLETDVSHSTPHVKNLDDLPGYIFP